MSLFEQGGYRWRDTYFVLCEERHRPTGEAIREILQGLGDRFEIGDVRCDGDGMFESLTMLCPMDYAGMDIIYNAGDDVVQQVEELVRELKHDATTRDEREKLRKIKNCTARFEIYHFEQIADVPPGEDEDDFLDPGGLLLVLGRLARFSHGVAIDPQSGAFM